ncbi:TetR/AcrR family transcriptional regulator [Coprobacter sp.]
MAHTENSHDMEQSILEAAEQLFLDKGFVRTSTTEIARTVGCNQTLIHYYFRTKENLFNRIFEKKLEKVIPQLFELSQQKVPFLERIRQIIEIHFSILQQNPKLPRMILNEISSDPKRTEWLRNMLLIKAQPYRIQFEKELEQAIQNGEIRPIEPTTLFLDILSMNVFIFLTYPAICKITGLKDDDFEKITEDRKKEAVTLITNGLRP